MSKVVLPFWFYIFNSTSVPDLTGQSSGLNEDVINSMHEEGTDAGTMVDTSNTD